MQRALNAKFSKHPSLAATLCSTYPRKLVFECAEDAYWGIGYDAKGTIQLLCYIKVFIESNLTNEGPFKMTFLIDGNYKQDL